MYLKHGEVSGDTGIRHDETDLATVFALSRVTFETHGTVRWECSATCNATSYDELVAAQFANAKGDGICGRSSAPATPGRSPSLALEHPVPFGLSSDGCQTRGVVPGRRTCQGPVAQCQHRPRAFGAKGQVVRLFRKTQKASKHSVSLALLELCGDGHCAVVGESFYQDALRRTAAICTPGEDGRPSFQAILVREPNNPYDSNAISVHSPQGQLGHLSKECALDYGEVLAEVARQGADGGACIGLLNGGTVDKPSYGVTLLLARPNACLRELKTSA